MKLPLIAGAVLAAACATAAIAQPPAAPTPAAAAPNRLPPPPTPLKGVPVPAKLAPDVISGVGFNVENLDAMRDWYVTSLGMKVIRTYERDGAAYEYILNIGGQGGNLALLKGARQPGATSFGRLILVVPDSEKLAAHFTSNGIAARKVADGAYFLRDPEGNNIEIYTAPAAPAKK